MIPLQFLLKQYFWIKSSVSTWIYAPALGLLKLGVYKMFGYTELSPSLLVGAVLVKVMTFSL